MTAIRRGALVLAVSTVLALGLWVVASVLGSPTPTPIEFGLYQPAVVGLEHVVQFMGFGAVLWTVSWAITRMLGLGGSRRRRRVTARG